MDVADGAGTLLFELAARTWSPEMLTALEIESGLAAGHVRGTEVTGRVSAAAAAATGLAAGTPIIAGGGDQAANAVGLGAVAPGTMALSLGTSGVVFAATAAPLFDPEARVHAFCHAVPGRWHFMSVMLSAAGSLRWFRDTLAPGVSLHRARRAGRSRYRGQRGASLPAIPDAGERSPYPDPLARGAFVGLDRGPRPRAPDAGRARGRRLRAA